MFNWKFFGTKTYEAYHNDLRYLVKKPIRAWLYGHTHYSSTFYIDDVMISTNQLGYNDSVNFDSGKYIDLVKIKDDNTKSWYIIWIIKNYMNMRTNGQWDYSLEYYNE